MMRLKSIEKIFYLTPVELVLLHALKVRNKPKSFRPNPFLLLGNSSCKSFPFFHFLTKSFRHNYFVCKSLRSKDICPSLGFNCFMIQNPIEIETGKKLTKQDRRNMKNDNTYEEQDDKLPGGGGGTLKISIYVGSAVFFGDQNFEFP